MLEHVFIFKHYHKSDIKGARFEFYKKQPVILVAAVELCSGSELSDQQLYFTGVFEDFGHIFRPVLKDVLNFKSRKYLLMCNIFLCGSKFATTKLIAATRITNINNTLTMISMGAM